MRGSQRDTVGTAHCLCPCEGPWLRPASCLLRGCWWDRGGGTCFSNLSSSHTVARALAFCASARLGPSLALLPPLLSLLCRRGRVLRHRRRREPFAGGSSCMKTPLCVGAAVLGCHSVQVSPWGRSGALRLGLRCLVFSFHLKEMRSRLTDVLF